MKKITLVAAALLACVTFGLNAKPKKVDIKSLADLAGKKIGVQAGTTGESYCQENIKDAKVVSFKNGMDAAMDLKNGGIDCIVLDELPARQIVKQNPKLTILQDPYFSANKEEYAIAIKKGNTDLLNSINKVIADMKSNGDYEALVNAFMPVNGEITVPAAAASTSSKKLKLGTNAAFPPFEYVDGKDIVGFDISMGQKIAKATDTQLEVVDMAFDSLIPALQAGTIDFIAAGMSVTEDRKKNVDFTDSYFASEQVIIIRK